MPTTWLKKMLYLTISNTLGVLVLACTVILQKYVVVDGKQHMQQPLVVLEDVMLMVCMADDMPKYGTWNTTVADIMATNYVDKCDRLNTIVADVMVT